MKKGLFFLFFFARNIVLGTARAVEIFKVWVYFLHLRETNQYIWSNFLNQMSSFCFFLSCWCSNCITKVTTFVLYTWCVWCQFMLAFLHAVLCSVSKRYLWQEAMFCLTSGETRRGSDQDQWAAIKEQILRGESVGKDTEGHKEQRELSPGAAKQAKRTCKTLGIHCPLCCHCFAAWRIIADVRISYLFACGSFDIVVCMCFLCVFILLMFCFILNLVSMLTGILHFCRQSRSIHDVTC